MSARVFWSWQSDRPGKVSRHFLKGVLDRAIEKIGESMGIDERPELDHDTKGEAGMVSIPDAILEKIDRAAVFVADITPVAVTDGGKHVANPNVLIELGYAKKALGPRQVIAVWNSAWGGCSPQDLPFDLRHRRAPFTYDLSPDASGTEMRRVADSLVAPLADAISACLKNLPTAEQPILRPIDARADDPSVWFEKGTKLVVAAGTSYGSDVVSFTEAPRAFLRVIPTSWPSDQKPEGTRDQLLELFPLGDSSGLCWGRTRGGFIVYHVEDRHEQNVTVTTATQWFAATGEIWGFDSRVVYDDDHGGKTIANVYVVECWDRFLSKAAEFYAYYDVGGPFEVRGGVTNLDGVLWPAARMFPSRTVAVEDSLNVIARVQDLDEMERRRTLGLLDASLHDVFGLRASSERLDELLQKSSRGR